MRFYVMGEAKVKCPNLACRETVTVVRGADRGVCPRCGNQWPLSRKGQMKVVRGGGEKK